MTAFDKVKELAKKRNKSLQDVALELGFGINYFYSWREGKQPSSTRLKKVANYFDVSIDYFMEDKPNISKTEIDLRKALENVVSFDGEEMTENDKEAIIAYMMGRKGK